jgi:putative transposase
VRLETVREVGPRLGVAPTCAALGVSTATYYRRVKPKPAARPRPTPVRALAAPEREAVLEVLHEPRFVDLAPAQVYAHLLDEGRYLCSPRTMYRLLAASDEVRERRDQLRHPRYTAPQLLATRPNEVWSWDITKLLGPVKWTYFYLYVILDIFSRYVVGWMIAHRESARLAQKLIAETCARQGIAPGTLTLHADRGSSMTSKPVALLLADLGVTKTHSRPHVSDDNPFSEAQFKTLKYRPDFPERFGSIEDARAHGRVFFPWYNTEHRHSGLGLLTPHDVHHGLADQRVEARTTVLAGAYAAHPERFVAGAPRPPARPTQVWINPPPATTRSTADPGPARGEEDTDAFRAPYSHAAESGRPDLRTQTQQLSRTRLPAASATEADEPAMTEATLH